MNIIFAHFWKIVSSFWTYCPVWVQIAQTVVHIAHFQVQDGSTSHSHAGCFVLVHIPSAILGKMRPHLGKVRPHLSNSYEKWAKVL